MISLTGKKLNFSFEGDSSLDYIHDYKNFIRLFSSHYVISKMNYVYFIEIVDIRSNGIAFIKFVKNLVPCVPPTLVSHKVWLRMQNEFCLVKFYDINMEKFLYGRGVNRYDPIVLVVPKKLFEDTICHLMSLNVNRFNVSHVFEYCRSINNRTIINGVSIVTPKKVSYDIYELFCCAMYCYAYNKRYYSNQFIKDIIDDEQRYRDQKDASFCSLLVKGFVRFVKNAFDSSTYTRIDEVNNLEKSDVNAKVLENSTKLKDDDYVLREVDQSFCKNKLRSLTERMKAFFEYERQYSVRIDKQVKYLEFEELIPGIICGTVGSCDGRYTVDHR